MRKRLLMIHEDGTWTISFFKVIRNTSNNLMCVWKAKHVSHKCPQSYFQQTEWKKKRNNHSVFSKLHVVVVVL